MSPAPEGTCRVSHNVPPGLTVSLSLHSQSACRLSETIMKSHEPHYCEFDTFQLDDTFVFSQSEKFSIVNMIS